MSTTTENQLVGLFRQSRTVWAIRAAAALIIGILVLVWPQATVSILAILLGIYFVILGVVRVIQGFVDKDLNGGGKAANFIIGALILAAGVIVIKNPFETAVFIVLLVGISWIFEGIATLVDTARGHGDGVSILIGMLIALAGVVVVLFAPAATTAYAVFFGIVLIIVAILDFVLLFAVGRAVKKAKA
ncbi:MAG: DUF308 domain-containing protein [Actinobacteria bacterium]|nr:DUF308 domain-containing protein [Actinomycetota bacterium]